MYEDVENFIIFYFLFFFYNVTDRHLKETTTLYSLNLGI